MKKGLIMGMGTVAGLLAGDFGLACVLLGVMTFGVAAERFLGKAAKETAARCPESPGLPAEGC